MAGQTLPTMAGPFGWAPGPWTGSSQMVDQPPTLSYPSALPSSGDALFNPAAGEAWRYFAAPFNNGGNDLWISFQEETSAAGSGASVVIMPLSGPDIQVNKAGGGAITLNGVAAGSSAGVGNVDFFVLQLSQFSGVTWVNLYLNPGPVLGPVPERFVPHPVGGPNKPVLLSNRSRTVPRRDPSRHETPRRRRCPRSKRRTCSQVFPCFRSLGHDHYPFRDGWHAGFRQRSRGRNLYHPDRLIHDWRSTCGRRKHLGGL